MPPRWWLGSHGMPSNPSTQCEQPSRRKTHPGRSLAPNNGPCRDINVTSHINSHATQKYISQTAPSPRPPQLEVLQGYPTRKIKQGLPLSNYLAALSNPDRCQEPNRTSRYCWNHSPPPPSQMLNNSNKPVNVDLCAAGTKAARPNQDQPLIELTDQPRRNALTSPIISNFDRTRTRNPAPTCNRSSS